MGGISTGGAPIGGTSTGGAPIGGGVIAIPGCGTGGIVLSAGGTAGAPRGVLKSAKPLSIAGSFAATGLSSVSGIIG
jgi:hypothetical protein